ncbi:MAG: ATP-binding cassette domain-containing protein [Ruminiclostridium sp.]|nr:ATP-binding cassette domain-containing protein [Ruminiclostridium sp.]
MDTVLFTTPKREATLVILDQGKVRTVALKDRERWTLGRAAGTITPDIPLQSTIASRQHGEFLCHDGRWYYKEGGSVNGTFHNGRFMGPETGGKTRMTILNSGDTLRIDYKDLTRPDERGVWMLFTTDLGAVTWRYRDLKGQSLCRIGREEGQCELVFPLPYVSACHAELRKKGNQWHLSDQGSTAGTWVNGIRVISSVLLREKDHISICDCHMIFTGQGLIYSARTDQRTRQEKSQSQSRSGGDVVLEANIQSKVVKDQSGHGQKELIRNVKLSVGSGQLVALLGGSGAGKTTVMNALNGMDQLGVKGQVLYRGEDLYRNFERLKYLIGSVPQENVVHDMLTVEEELRDAALLRLPKDMGSRGIQRQVEDTMAALNLTQKRKTQIRKLSGGERKRVNIGVELVADRELLCLDEPDAGLDPLAKKDLFTTLRDLAHDRGKSILVIIHDVSEIDLFDQVIMMAKVDGVGRLAFEGSPAAARTYFGVEDLSEAYVVISKDPKRYVRG